MAPHFNLQFLTDRWYWTTFHMLTAAAVAKSLQSCPTLCDPRDGSPPGSPIPGILQVRTLEWVAISFSNAWKWKVKSESEVAQSCPTLSDPMDCSPPGSSIHRIFQARVLEWGAIAFSIICLLLISCFSHVWLFATPWTLAHQAPLSIGFSRREYWRELPYSIPGDFLTQRLKLCLLYCRQFLYPWSHCGSPYVFTCVYITHVYVHTYRICFVSTLKIFSHL